MPNPTIKSVEEIAELVKTRPWLKENGFMMDHKDEFRSTCSYQECLSTGVRVGYAQCAEEISTLKKQLEIGVEALEQCGKSIRYNFHHTVCFQSRGCHCSPNMAEIALSKITALNKEGN